MDRIDVASGQPTALSPLRYPVFRATGSPTRYPALLP